MSQPKNKKHQAKPISHVQTRIQCSSEKPLSPPRCKQDIRNSPDLKASNLEEPEKVIKNGTRCFSNTTEESNHCARYSCTLEFVPKTVPWDLKFHFQGSNQNIPQISDSDKNSASVGKEQRRNEKLDFFSNVKKWVMKIFPYAFVEESNIPEEERILAKALCLSIRDLENALLPLKQLDLLHVRRQSARDRGGSDWPLVRVTELESVYGKCWKIVGKGTGGIVKLFRREDGKMFAVKEFRPRKMESSKNYGLAVAIEYCIGAILDHPHVIKTLELIVQNGKLYEIMEYCESDLFNFIKNGDYKPEDVRITFRQLAEGVKYLHGLGIAHRDLKPENVCIIQGQVKIIDFGLCSIFKLGYSGKTRLAHGLCGSAPYIAPEEWDCKDYDPTKVDIWSVGIILVTLLYQAFPWEVATKTDSNFSIFLKCLKTQKMFPLFKDLDDLCYSLIISTLNPNPKLRASIDDVLNSEWLQL